MGRADLKQRSRHPKKKSRTNPTLTLDTPDLRTAIFFLDRFEEAESALQRASERKVGTPNFPVILYILAVLKGDKDEMDRVVSPARGKRQTEHRLAHTESLALARSGRLQAARGASSRAVDLALQEGDRESVRLGGR